VVQSAGERFQPAPRLEPALQPSAPLELGSVHTTLNHFNITFTARPHASPAVQYGTEAPVRTPGTEHWFFKAPLPAKVIEATYQRTPIPAEYVAMPAARLEPGTRYYFIITVPAGPAGKPAEQYTGAFRTRSEKEP
jgi:hypothetical protein